MDGRGKITKEILCDESRFILANVIAESKYGRRSTVEDMRRICDDSISIPFGEYVAFLVSSGYLRQDHDTNTLDVTGRGEDIVNGGNIAELSKAAVSHFKSIKEQRGSAPPKVDEAPRSRRQSSRPSARQGARASVPPAAPMSMESMGYEKLDEIGSGGIGTVYRAKQIALNREVALKELRELFSLFSASQRSELTQRFTDVVCGSANLAHPNILPVHDIKTDCEYPFVVTELCPNGSVRRLISDAETIPVRLALQYLVQSLRALSAAHKEGLVHRGLKPENLLIDAYGNLKMSDFGFAKIVERDQKVIRQVFVGMGSVGYMAPELFQNALDVTPQSDIYALGIIFYELLTRKLPGRRSPLPSEIDSKIPSAVDDIFDLMTRDTCNERYASADDVLADFERIEDIGKIFGAQTQVLALDNPLEEISFNNNSAEPVKTTSPKDFSTPASADPESAESEGTASSSKRRPYSYQQRNKK